MKHYGTWLYNGQRLTLLAPPWVFRFVQAMLQEIPERPGDRARFVETLRDADRLDNVQRRIAEARKAHAKPVIKVLSKRGGR